MRPAGQCTKDRALANTIHGIGGMGRVQERLTPRARRASHCGGGVGSGARTDISSVIELCAFDRSIFCVVVFVGISLKTKRLRGNYHRDGFPFIKT